MGWSFRKRIKIAPGIRLNISKSGISTSIGGKGFTYNTRGRVTASIPGTGVRFTHTLRRTANPVRSVVAGSSRIDATSTERLSKREQAARDFVALVQSRTSDALLQYFLSHGVYVRRDELSDAVTLEKHQDFLETLTREFEATTKAVRLAVDIGSISLAEKEKAMLAVYEIERKCAGTLGGRGQLAEEAVSLADAVASWPKSPSFVAPFLLSLLCPLFVLLGSIPIGLVFLAASFGFGWFNISWFNKKIAATVEALGAANASFDAFLEAEISPRPAIDGGDERMAMKAAIVGALAIALAGLTIFQQMQNDHREVAVSTNPDAVASATSVVAAAQGDSQQSGFGWLVGKYPSDVATDKRFRVAFNHVSRSDWRLFVDRLAVTSSAGIYEKDGFIMGEGCKAHACASDNAAFAINETTGKGDIVYIDAANASVGKAAAKAIIWKELPLASTPLADWLKANQVLSGTGAASAASASSRPTLQTSFDCNKAQSDAEHLICTDSELAADDIELASLYAKAKAVATDQTVFKDHSRAAWNYREQTCHDRDCLVKWYVDQKTVLQQIADTGKDLGE